VLISAGPTREPLDPVRFLSNYSTGYMGQCLVREALARGHRVVLVSGPTDLPPLRGARIIRVEQAREMQQALRRELPKADALVMAAAVADFQPARRSRKKLGRTGTLRLTLTATPDIIGGLPRRPGQVIVGFALETADAKTAQARAARKLRAKRLDLIVGQSMPQARPRQRRGTSPFGRRTVDAFLLGASGEAKRLGQVSKPKLARAILDEIGRLWYGEKDGTSTTL